MKPFSVACEDAFHKRYEGVEFQDDAAINIWREAWFAAFTLALDLFANELPEGRHD